MRVLGDVPESVLFLFDTDGYMYAFRDLAMLAGWLEEIVPVDSCYDMKARKISVRLDCDGRFTWRSLGDGSFESELRAKISHYFDLQRKRKKIPLPEQSDLKTFLREVVAIVGWG